MPTTVLVVDDDPETTESLVELLSLRGLRARAVLSASDALDDAAADPPDVFVLDLMMPGMDGIELARRLAAIPKPPVLIAVTGCEEEVNHRRARKAGICLHLVKPVPPAVLVDAIQRLVRRGDAPSPA